MITKTANTVAEYIDAVLSIRSAWFPNDRTPEIWFRGSENRSFELLPGACWRANCDEHSLVLTFKNVVPSYLGREPLDDWEWYYLMQHYGLPTRLLDWTESALVGLFFAFYAEPSGGGPCVWILDPVSLNRVAQGFTDESLIVPASADVNAPSRYWLPEFCRPGGAPATIEPARDQFTTNENPLAVFPKRYNPRI